VYLFVTLRYYINRLLTYYLVDGMRSVDGANTNDALLRSVDFLVRYEDSDPLSTRVSMILLITDSNPTVGISDAARLLSNVRQASGGRVSINVFALSAEVGRPFLSQLAQQNRGQLQRCCGVGTSGRLVTQLKRFYQKTSSPLLKNVRFRYGEEVDESTLTTVDYPAYFEGCELVVVGRLRPRVSHLAVKVSGSSTQVNTHGSVLQLQGVQGPGPLLVTLTFDKQIGTRKRLSSLTAPPSLLSYE